MRRAVLAVAVATVLAACSAGGASPPSETVAVPASTPAPASSTPAPAPVTPVAAPDAVQHVHNVALLADGALLLGTHEGLWRQDAPGERFRLLADPFDVMGFALTGDGWLASGHPAPGSGGPPDLGLLRSTDEGRSWKTVSLAGEADFHRLTSSGDTLLAANSGDGLLWRSGDGGRSWRTLGPAPFDIALDPEDPARAVGTTADGPVASDDGGRSWRRTGADTRIALLTWQPKALYGVAVDGSVHVSGDAGMTWEKVGRVKGQPGGLAGSGEALAVLAGDTVWVSTDGGRTFDARVTGIPG